MEVQFLPGFTGARRSSPEQHESVTFASAEKAVRHVALSIGTKFRWYTRALARSVMKCDADFHKLWELISICQAAGTFPSSPSRSVALTRARSLSASCSVEVVVDPGPNKYDPEASLHERTTVLVHEGTRLFLSIPKVDAIFVLSAVPGCFAGGVQDDWIFRELISARDSFRVLVLLCCWPNVTPSAPCRRADSGH